MRRHVLLVAALSAAGASGAERCLEDAIAPSERRNLINTEGEIYPVGIWVSQWASGELTAAMAQILIQEKLGFHVLTEKGSVTIAQLFAMAGCKTPKDGQDRGCSPAPTQTYFHVGMEGWTPSNQVAWDKIHRDLPATAPVNLGYIGYDGISGQYILPEVLQRAEAEGLYLEFYRSYNASVHHPGLYFDRITAVNTSNLKPCTETYLFNPANMQSYLEATADWDGVELVNGTVRGKCFEEYFWLPPACRLDTSKCFLFLTCFGYEFEVIMQRATIFDMPVVPVDVKDWDTYAKLAVEISSLFYWWEPDPTFIGLSTKMITYPRHNSSAWDQGVFLSMAQGIRLDKYGSHDLEVLAPTVRELIGAFSLKMDVLNQLLLHQKMHGTSAMEVACTWLKGHRNIWEEWLPDTTKCFPQFGLFNEVTEVFVESREGDSSNLICKACLSGSFSAPLRDGQGLTSVCLSCAPGSFQSSGASTACEPCPLGEHQEDFGAASCNRCTAGSYQNVTGQSLCKTCPEKRTTLGLGAESLAECVCKAGLIEMEGQCVPCIKGLSCPIGSTAEGLLIATLPVNESDAGVQRPFLLQGYNSHPTAPLTIYRCRDHCPGGSPGSCSDGRVGLTCGECPRGTFASLRGHCAHCAEGSQALSTIGGGVLFFLGIFPAYVLLTQPYSSKTQLGGLTASILGLVANLAQNLLVISTAPTSWPALMLGMTNVLNVMTLNPELLSVACVGLDAVTLYFMRALVFPAVVGILLVASAFSRLLPSAFLRIRGCAERLRVFHGWIFVTRLFEKWTWHGTACVIGKFCQVTFPTMAYVGLSPMMCYKHPGSQIHSLVLYSNTFCFTSDHVLMLTVGAALLSFTAGFLVFCIWAGRRAPRLSLQGQAAVKFLFEEFRPDMAWFGIVTLSRGLFLSLPSVIVPNRPNIQLVMMHSVMLISLVFQGYCQPWKSPASALNLVDAISQSLFLTLLGVGLGGLEQSEAAVDVLMTLGTFFCFCLLLVFGLALLTFGTALLLERLDRFPKALAFGRRCASLGEVPESALMVFLLHNLASSIKRTISHRNALTAAMDELGTHDARMILMSLTILEMEMGLSATRSSSISLPAADAELVKQLSDFSEPYRIAGGSQQRAPRGAMYTTAVAKRRLSCQAAAFRERLNFSGLSGLSQESLDNAGSTSPMDDDLDKAQESLNTNDCLDNVEAENMVRVEF
eukprot:s2959_g2.t2